MTPLALEILVWSYDRGVHKDAQPHYQFDGMSQPDAVAQTALDWLREHDLIQNSVYDGVFGVTSRGAALIEICLKTPLPEQRWVDPRVP